MLLPFIAVSCAPKHSLIVETGRRVFYICAHFINVPVRQSVHCWWTGRKIQVITFIQQFTFYIFAFVFFTETKDIRFHNIIYFKDLFWQIKKIYFISKQLIQNFIPNVLFYFKMHVKSDFLLHSFSSITFSFLIWINENDRE